MGQKFPFLYSICFCALFALSKNLNCLFYRKNVIFWQNRQNYTEFPNKSYSGFCSVPSTFPHFWHTGSMITLRTLKGFRAWVSSTVCPT